MVTLNNNNMGTKFESTLDSRQAGPGLFDDGTGEASAMLGSDEENIPKMVSKDKTPTLEAIINRGHIKI